MKKSTRYMVDIIDVEMTPEQALQFKDIKCGGGEITRYKILKDGKIQYAISEEVINLIKKLT